MLLVDQVKQAIDEDHELTGGMCGLPVTKLCLQLQQPYKEVRKALGILYKENYYSVRKGLNDHLLFRNTNHKTK